ncbi:F0F1 ATP synthase subunit delta [Candidatus Profftia sp. (ex Adelges kitamiensis)]|uniref:F0F1 ATP synthase subunit delta n=1 Tax=Candidatus Profftia sp. (ex Adelges kitamiensis) TaxID=2864218 RepID=UPI001CE2ACE7|nr:F0F1 ATP synthase subunit delta [Candidatus Profftia sp. (ex Adelges kitamiensis)]
MSICITLARPYAKAAFEYSVEHHSINHWQQMLTFCNEIVCNKRLAKIFSGNLTLENTTDIFIKLCGDQIDEYGLNFIRIIAKNKRLLFFPEILRQFNIMRDIQNAQINVEITLATTLPIEDLKHIGDALETRLSRKVKMHCKIDKSIIAGVVIRAGDLVIDGSIRNRLKLLAESLET